MVDVRCTEYAKDQVVAEDKLIQPIGDLGVKAPARATGLDSKTVMLTTGGSRSTRARLWRRFDSLRRRNGDSHSPKHVMPCW